MKFRVMPRKQQNMRHSLGNPFPRKPLIEPKEKGIALAEAQISEAGQQI